MRTSIRRITGNLLVVLLLGFLVIVLVDRVSVESAQAASPTEDAAGIIKATGVDGGLVVHLGCGSGELTAALRMNSRYQVHGLDRQPKNVQRARQHIQSLGSYGEVSADQLRGQELPYTDNLVNLVVVENSLGVTQAEVMRVLVPLGVAYVKEGDQWQRHVKPRSKELDEWTH
ncbi:MAG: class I SAM-dependent methyltransferase, partial [Pirellulaceae bacterium]